MECLTEYEVFAYGYQYAQMMVYKYHELVSLVVNTGTPEVPDVQTFVYHWVPQISAYCTGTPA
jgi:hypothetical protein